MMSCLWREREYETAVCSAGNRYNMYIFNWHMFIHMLNTVYPVPLHYCTVAYWAWWSDDKCTDPLLAVSALFDDDPNYNRNSSNMITIHVPLSHLRSKSKASAYILYCTGSGMLTTYTQCGQCNIKNTALTTVHISRYYIPKSPKNHQISLMQHLTECLFI